MAQKLRLNVSATREGDSEDVGKVLVVVETDANFDQFATKIQKAFAKRGVDGRVTRLLNSLGASLPDDEVVGDLLRDNDELTAVLQEVTNADLAAAGDSVCSKMEHTAFSAGGPVECFEADMQAGESLALRSAPGGDWEVENITPKLREYISLRFSESRGAVDAGQSFITVTMKPYDADPDSGPLHYSVARVDIIDFERLCGRKVEETRRTLDVFQRRHGALEALLSQSAAPSDYAPNMLPYKYRAEEEVGTLLSETDAPGFGQAERFRPVIVVDTSGAVGESIVYIKAALKRMLYSFLVAKSKFNLLKFNSHGRPVMWDSNMVPPTQQKLREAEDFIDGLRPLRGSPDFLGGLHLALSPLEVDVVYVLTSGLPRRGNVDYILDNMRANNLRELPVHIIGVECEPKAELDLRRLAEENGGTFRKKRFDGLASVEPGHFQRQGPQHIGAMAGNEPDDGRLTIGGQLDILEIMFKEQELQAADWLQEQRCANRLLLATATQQPVPSAEQEHDAFTRLAKQSMKSGRAGYGEVLEAAPLTRRPVARGLAPRRGAAQPAQRASSQPKTHGATLNARVPSVANPWDRPGSFPGSKAPIRVSQMAAKSSGASNRSNSAKRGSFS